MNKNIFILLLISCTAILSSGLFAQTRNVPAPAQDKAILLKGATLHLGNGEKIEQGVIAFDQGKITLVQEGMEGVDESAYEVIEVSGQHIYPGFFLLTTNMGISEVSSVRAMADNAEYGTYNPNIRSIVAYNTDSEFIPTMRFNGLLMAQVVPQGGVISGSSSIVQLDAWDWEDAAYHTEDAIHINWPRKYFPPSRFRGETEPRKNTRYDQTILELKQMMNDAKVYSQLTDRSASNLKLMAMEGLFDGSKTLHIHTNEAKDILSGASFAMELGVKKIVIVGGGQAMLVKDFLKENEIPVIFGNVHALPNEDHEDTVYPFKMAKELYDAGITYSLMYRGMTSRARNIPFMAGTTVAYGVPYEEAVKSISLNAAKILGIDDRVGSLEKGKDATLFVSAGDALDMRTQNLDHIFIQGRKVQLNTRQQWLYEKYSKKYGHDMTKK